MLMRERQRRQGLAMHDRNKTTQQEQPTAGYQLPVTTFPQVQQQQLTLFWVEQPSEPLNKQKICIQPYSLDSFF